MVNKSFSFDVFITSFKGKKGEPHKPLEIDDDISYWVSYLFSVYGTFLNVWAGFNSVVYRCSMSVSVGIDALSDRYSCLSWTSLISLFPVPSLSLLSGPEIARSPRSGKASCTVHRGRLVPSNAEPLRQRNGQSDAGRAIPSSLLIAHGSHKSFPSFSLSFLLLMCNSAVSSFGLLKPVKTLFMHHILSHAYQYINVYFDNCHRLMMDRAISSLSITAALSGKSFSTSSPKLTMEYKISVSYSLCLPRRRACAYNHLYIVSPTQTFTDQRFPRHSSTGCRHKFLYVFRSNLLWQPCDWHSAEPSLPLLHQVTNACIFGLVFSRK